VASARLLHGRESRVQSSEMKRFDVRGDREVKIEQRKKGRSYEQKRIKQNRKKEKRKKGTEEEQKRKNSKERKN
jgi:hypothetical protein